MMNKVNISCSMAPADQRYSEISCHPDQYADCNNRLIEMVGKKLILTLCLDSCRNSSLYLSILKTYIATNTVSKTEDMTPKKKPAECIITESGKAFLHAMAAPVSPMMIEKSVTGI